MHTAAVCMMHQCTAALHFVGEANGAQRSSGEVTTTHSCDARNSQGQRRAPHAHRALSRQEWSALQAHAAIFFFWSVLLVDGIHIFCFLTFEGDKASLIVR